MLYDSLRRWLIITLVTILVILPLSHLYLEFVHHRYLLKMELLRREGIQPLLDPDILRSMDSFYIFNSSLFYSLPLGLLAGTLIWMGNFLIQHKRKEKYLLLLLLLIPLISLPGKSLTYFRIVRDRWLYPSILGKNIVNWYYLYSPLATEGIKGFWEKEQKVVKVGGEIRKELKRWAERRNILLVGKGEGADLELKGRDFSRENLDRFTLSPYLKVLRFFLALSLFYFSPLYIILFLAYLFSIPFRYFRKNSFKFSLSLISLFTLSLLLLPVYPGTSLPPEKDKLLRVALGDDVYLSLRALDKLFSLNPSLKFLKELFLMERRWYPRTKIWKEMIRRGWDGKNISMEE